MSAIAQVDVTALLHVCPGLPYPFRSRPLPPALHQPALVYHVALTRPNGHSILLSKLYVRLYSEIIVKNLPV